MDITEAKVKLVSDRADKLKAFCTITIDGEFVIRDIKIIKGSRGCFVAMPSRKLMDRCPSCGGKNHLRAAYCNECGAKLRENRVSHDLEGRAKLHADIAHPINSACRERLQRRILEAYEAELDASRQPGDVPSPDDEVILDTVHGLEEPPRPADLDQTPEAAAPESDRPADESSVEAADTAPPAPGPPPEAGSDSFSSGIL